MRNVYPLFLQLAVLCLVIPASAIGQLSGSLDPDFGSGGLLMPCVPGATKAVVRKIAMQADGRIVALFESDAGFWIGRFESGGGVDASFGTGGFVNANWPAGPGSSPKNVAVQGDGKVLVSGFAPLGRNASAWRFERFNIDGSVDNSFGSSGAAAVNLTGGNALALLPNGKILAMSAGGELVRLNQNGSLDTSFGSGGIASPKLALSPWFNGLLVLPSGKIVATGHTVVSNAYRFTVAGYNENGSLDDGGRADSTPGDRFGTSGSVIVSFSGFSGGRGYDIKLDQSGRLVVLGGAGTQNSAIGIARMTVTGNLDASFGSGGRIVFTHPNGSPQGTALGIQSDGRILAIGGFYMGTAPDGSPLRDAMVVRFSTSGLLDSFDVGQFVLTDVFGSDEFAYDGGLRFDPVCNCERILWAGGIYTGQTGAGRTPLLLQYLP